MKKLKTYNESVKDFLKSKVSKEDVIKRVMEEPSFARWDYIMDNNLEDLFTDIELEQFEKDIIYVDYSDNKLFYAEFSNKRYYIVYTNDDHPYIFDEDWNKVKDDEYETIKYTFELFKIRLDID